MHESCVCRFLLYERRLFRTHQIWRNIFTTLFIINQENRSTFRFYHAVCAVQFLKMSLFASFFLYEETVSQNILLFSQRVFSQVKKIGHVFNLHVLCSSIFEDVAFCVVFFI